MSSAADPRSANLNSELMLVCRESPVFAAAIKRSIEDRLKRAEPVLVRGRLEDRWLLLQGAPTGQLLRFWAELPLANLFDFLL